MTRIALRSTAFLPSLLAMTALLGLSGCAQKEADTTTATAPAASPSAAASPEAGAGAALKVGLITVGPITDKGWSQTAYEGVQKVKTETGATVSQPVENPGLAAVEGALRNLSQDGNTLVFANGSEYDDAAKKVAPDLPNTTISIINGRSVAKNLMPIQFDFNQATYVAGMIAAGMSKTGKIGCVGPTEIPVIKDCFAAFEKGAKAEKPDIKVTITFVGSEDIAKAKQQTQALLDQGVDVVLGNANNGNNGVAQAVTEKDGAMFIGANADQRDLATPKNIGSFILDVPAAMVAVAKNVQGGKNAGQAYKGGLADKAVGFVYNPGFKGTIPADLKTKIDATEADLSSGKLKVD